MEIQTRYSGRECRDPVTRAQEEYLQRRSGTWAAGGEQDLAREAGKRFF